MNKGLIFDIRRFSVNDGPGIRTTVFFKGCSLNCWWCHNPESRKFGSEICIRPTRLGSREFLEEETIGKLMDVEEVMEIIRKDEVFYKTSDGGVTFSGGEPLLQAGFLKSLLIKCKEENFHTAVDTSGYGERSDFAGILPFAGLFLYDLKPMSSSDHIEYTGVDNHPVLENLKYLFSENQQIIIRIPLIPGITDTSENIDMVIDFLFPFKDKITRIDLLPYHSSAKNKYLKLKIPNRMEGLTIEYHNDIEGIKKKLELPGFNVKIN